MSTADANTKVKEEEAIPVLKLTVVSKKGTTPSDIAGSLKIPLEDSADLKLFSSGAETEPPVNIVQGAKLPSDPKWRVLVNLSNDHLPKATVVKEKMCQKYVCINALLSFNEIVDDKRRHLLSEEINPGEWLLPIKVGDVSDAAKATLLAYVRVKIEDQTDKPAADGPSDQSKSGLNTQDTAKKG